MTYDRKKPEPPIEEPELRHRKKRGGRKPFIIEVRYIGPVREWEGSLFSKIREWHVWNRYKTEKQRDQAWETLQRKGVLFPIKEYRKVN